MGSWTQYREDELQNLESAPTGNGNEQTVGSLIFAPMLHVMSETNADNCQTCVFCARDVFGTVCFVQHVTSLTTMMFFLLSFVAFHAYQFNFRQVKACVTTWRKPRRRWTEKN